MNERSFRTAVLLVVLLLAARPASAVLPRDARTDAAKARGTHPVERRLTAPRGQRTTVVTRGAEVALESRDAFDELRVIVTASGDPLILEPVSRGPSLTQLRDQRLAALDRLADDIVRADNQVREQYGEAARSRAQIVTRSYTHVLNGLAARVHRASLQRLRTLPGVTGVWIDQQKTAALAESVPLIRADQVWSQLGYRGTGVTVAVIDTGVDYHRPDLGGCFGPGCKVEFGYDLVNNDTDPMDDYGHGTHVAGIVAANGTVKGVAPLARVWAYKVLDQYGNGYDSMIIAGIEMATDPDNNPNTHDGAKIINMSLGGPGDPDDALSQASDNAMAGGTLVVVAAGNSGPDFGTLGSPACARQVLTVGASDKSDQMAYFSSRGPATTTWQIKPEVIAPGVSITSTVPTGSCTLCDPTGYLALNGTSMATPHVAGVAALVIERYPSWTPPQVKAAIMQRTIDFSYGAYVQGAGRLDAWNAITPQARVDIPAFSPGLDDSGPSAWTRSQTFTLTNLGGSSAIYTLSVVGSFPPGLLATVSPGSVTIPGNQSRAFTFTLNVDNALVPNVPADPFAYEGTIKAVSGSEMLHVPFAFLKAPSLTLNFDQDPWTVIITDNATWYRYFNYPPRSFSILTPNLTLDVVTMFPDAVSYVLHEGLQVVSSTQVNIARAQAIYPFTIVPVDSTGADLTLTASTTLAHLGSKSHFLDSYLNADFHGNLGSPTTFWLSSMSNHYAFDVGVLQEPGGVAPTYFYYGLAADGIQEPKTFRNTAASFRHVTWAYKVDPGRSAVFPLTWLSSRPYGSAVIAFAACDASLSTTPPFRREVYLTPLPNGQAGVGFLKQSVYGAAPQTSCSTFDYLFETPYLAATSPTELDAWTLFNSSPVLRTANTLFTSGVGPYHWNGFLLNTYDVLNVYGDTGSWYVSQLHDVRPYAGLPYELRQMGEIVQSGTSNGSGSYEAVQLAVEPGRYMLRVPFTQWYLGSQPGRAETLLSFDTQTGADPNPPTLKNLTIEHGGAFLDLLPANGGTVSFTAGDDSGALLEARLYYKTASGYAPAAVSGNLSTGFTATVPPPGGPPPTGPVALFLRDGNGNGLTYSYCSAATASVEVCDGFDDNCDGVLLPEELDTDGDSLSACGGDCDDTDGSIWDTPGEVSGLIFVNHAEMYWSLTQSGGMANYKILRSPDPRDFVNSTICVYAFDSTTPAPGAAFFYQVRAWNYCPNGQGSLGAASNGTPRVGRFCP